MYNIAESFFALYSLLQLSLQYNIGEVIIASCCSKHRNIEGISDNDRIITGR